MKHARRGFAASQVKMGVAGLFAAAGLAWAAWVVFAGGGGERKPETPRAEQVSVPLDNEGNPIDTAYQSTKRDSGAVVGQLGTLAEQGAVSVPGFAQLGGSAAGLAESLKLAVGPLVSGDHAAFLAAMQALGAALGEMDGEHPLFTRLAEKLKGAQVDLSRLEITRHEERTGPVIQRRERAEGEQGEGGPSNINVNERVMEMRPANLFPAATGRVDDKAVDIKFPFKPKDADEQWFGMTLVWMPDLKKWQPGAFRIIDREVTVTP
jgi:hypothetical protein